MNGDTQVNTAPALHQAAPAPTLADVRSELVGARAELRCYEAALKTERARAEQRAIDPAGGVYGSLKNEAERARFLTLALAEDAQYRLAIQDEEEARHAVETLEAQIVIHEDARRARQMAQRDRELDLQVSELERDAAKLDQQDRAIALQEREIALGEQQMAHQEKLRELAERQTDAGEAELMLSRGVTRAKA